jgi:hypothetical protein
MVDLAMLQVVRDLVAIFGVIAGFSYYVLTVRNTQKNQQLQLETRQAQLFSQYHLFFNNKEFVKDRVDIRGNWEWEDYDDFVRKYGSQSGDMDAYSQWIHVLAYYEGLGVLVRRGLIDVQLVDDMMSGAITRYWEKHRQLYYEMRERLNWPQIAEQAEYLYDRIVSIVEEQHPELKT